MIYKTSIKKHINHGAYFLADVSERDSESRNKDPSDPFRLSAAHFTFSNELTHFYRFSGAVVYPRASQIEPCSKPLDLMIVLDSSGSVSDVWNNTIDYTEKLLSNFNIADDQVRVGLIEFSMVANALLPLDSGNSLGRLNQILEEARISPQNGETHTDKALYLAASIFRASPRTYTVPRVSGRHYGFYFVLNGQGTNCS